VNKKPTIFVTRKYPAPVEQRLVRDFDARLNLDDSTYSGADLIAGAADVDGLMVTITDRVTADVIDALPDRVRVIATFSVGFEHIDVAAATARGIVVTNTPDVLTDATADIALLLLLGAARRAVEGVAMIRHRTWGSWSPEGFLGTDVRGKRLGIFGMGRIGQAVAHRARAFGLEIHYHARTRLSPDLEQGATFHETAEDLLRVSDILSINAAATPDTARFLNAERIELLPENAIVINTSRGSLVDEDALIAALKDGRLAAAGLDVYDNEPDINPAFREISNAFLLPHLGSATHETRAAMAYCALDNLDAFFAGRTPPNVVT
jgi:lactate dehydrogenase-like 2-hydroxyacid dehydrogenase